MSAPVIEFFYWPYPTGADEAQAAKRPPHHPRAAPRPAP